MANITLCVNKKCPKADNCYRHSTKHDRQTVWQSYAYLDCFGVSEYNTENFYVPIKEESDNVQSIK